MHVVRLVGAVGNDVEQPLFAPVHRVIQLGGSAARRLVEVVTREIADQLAHRRQRLGLGRVDEMGHAGNAAVYVGAAQLLEAHVLVGDRLHHVGASHEHVADAADHEDEIGDGGTVDRTARAGPEDDRDLGNDARGEGVAQEDVGVAAERGDSLLDASAARVVEPDDRRAVAHREIHHLADLLGEGLGERTAEDGEILEKT